ncbi:GFA family protein [Cognatiyoonia sp. IB215182]|uniref:GFA family protein n=1 Tax=Cognatiyoonia sp. IB215182 TaxID=3097353 RepID=UPI002A15C92B|nr:GFA family protein [Cognatiyoonia sp. IB215182]MDX8353809.1 GFA family protein [Cognatiyoonia sp. IB215182]
MLKGTCHCGQVNWTLDDDPESITACNCTTCRRYGALWAYGYVGHSVHVAGQTETYRRKDGGTIAYHFCPTCGCLTHYVENADSKTGKSWTGVNTRMCDPAAISALPIDHFDGLKSFDDLPRDGRTVADMWF